MQRHVVVVVGGGRGHHLACCTMRATACQICPWQTFPPPPLPACPLPLHASHQSTLKHGSMEVPEVPNPDRSFDPQRCCQVDSSAHECGGYKYGTSTGVWGNWNESEGYKCGVGQLKRRHSTSASPPKHNHAHTHMNNLPPPPPPHRGLGLSARLTTCL